MRVSSKICVGRFTTIMCTLMHMVESLIFVKSRRWILESSWLSRRGERAFLDNITFGIN